MPPESTQRLAEPAHVYVADSVAEAEWAYLLGQGDTAGVIAVRKRHPVRVAGQRHPSWGRPDNATAGKTTDPKTIGPY